MSNTRGSETVRSHPNRSSQATNTQRIDLYREEEERKEIISQCIALLEKEQSEKNSIRKKAIISSVVFFLAAGATEIAFAVLQKLLKNYVEENPHAVDLLNDKIPPLNVTLYSVKRNSTEWQSWVAKGGKLTDSVTCSSDDRALPFFDGDSYSCEYIFDRLANCVSSNPDCSINTACKTLIPKACEKKKELLAGGVVTPLNGETTSHAFKRMIEKIESELAAIFKMLEEEREKIKYANSNWLEFHNRYLGTPTNVALFFAALITGEIGLAFCIFLLCARPYYIKRLNYPSKNLARRIVSRLARLEGTDELIQQIKKGELTYSELQTKLAELRIPQLQSVAVVDPRNESSEIQLALSSNALPTSEPEAPRPITASTTATLTIATQSMQEVVQPATERSPTQNIGVDSASLVPPVQNAEVLVADPRPTAVSTTTATLSLAMQSMQEPVRPTERLPTQNVGTPAVENTEAKVADEKKDYDIEISWKTIKDEQYRKRKRKKDRRQYTHYAVLSFGDWGDNKPLDEDICNDQRYYCTRATLILKTQTELNELLKCKTKSIVDVSSSDESKDISKTKEPALDFFRGFKGSGQCGIGINTHGARLKGRMTAKKGEFSLEPEELAEFILRACPHVKDLTIEHLGCYGGSSDFMTRTQTKIGELLKTPEFASHPLKKLTMIGAESTTREGRGSEDRVKDNTDGKKFIKSYEVVRTKVPRPSKPYPEFRASQTTQVLFDRPNEASHQSSVVVESNRPETNIILPGAIG